MLIPSHMYIVESCSDIKQKNGFSFRRLVLVKPAPENEIGDKMGKDDVFQVTAWNKDAEEIPALRKGSKIEGVLAMKGKAELDRKDGSTHYSVLLSIQRIKKV